MPKHWDIPGNEQKPEWMQSEERSTEDAKQRNNVGAIQNSPNNTTCATAAYVSEGGIYTNTNKYIGMELKSARQVRSERMNGAS